MEIKTDDLNIGSKPKSQSEAAFYEFLTQELRFPKESILFEPRVDNVKYVPDFSILDIHRQEKIAFIEVKANIRNISKINERVRDNFVQLVGFNVPCFLVNHNDSSDEFEFYKFNPDELELKLIDISLFPSFETLSFSYEANRKNSLREEKNATSNELETACRFVFIASMALFVIDIVLGFFDFKILSSDRLILLGLIFGVKLFPFIQKLKILGLELERTINYDNNKSDK